MTTGKRNQNSAELLFPKAGDRIELSFYADPLCCYSWAQLGEIEKLQAAFPGRTSVKVYLGGMIQSWDKFSDPLNSINKPSQMGPLWMDAKVKTGIPFNESIWVEDPPTSSFPACIAIKTAALQSKETACDYLKLLMKGVMLEGKNISKPEVLKGYAEMLALQNLSFSMERFLKEYNQEQSREAFRQDIQKARINNIGRFPTITLTSPGKRGIIITGYRPAEILEDAFYALGV